MFLLKNPFSPNMPLKDFDQILSSFLLTPPEGRDDVMNHEFWIHKVMSLFPLRRMSSMDPAGCVTLEWVHLVGLPRVCLLTQHFCSSAVAKCIFTSLMAVITIRTVMILNFTKNLQYPRGF